MWYYNVEVHWMLLSFILQFVTNSEHNNVIIIDAPRSFDLEASSCVNKEINASSR
jgi:hypothetical protein